MASTTNAPTVYCQRCGTPMTPEDRFCRKCGFDSQVPWSSAAVQIYPANASDRKRLVALLLCFFLGVFGVHRFYVGRIGTGFIWLFTLGIFGLGWIYDMILIAAGELKDSEGRKVVIWT